MSHIIPTIFSKSEKEFKRRFSNLIKISERIQIDYMDGKFVKSRSISLDKTPNLIKYGNIFEAHLMVKNPLSMITQLSDKGFKKIIFHIESCKKNEVFKLIKTIKDNEAECFIAINPDTPLSKISPFVKIVDGILVMGVKPGKEGQPLNPNTLKRIKEIKSMSKSVIIQIDGGVNPENARQLVKAGANLLNSGNFVSSSDSPIRSIYILEYAFK